MRIRLALVTAILFLGSGGAAAQSLSIGAVEVRLGEDGAAVLSRFQRYRIQDFGPATHAVLDNSGRSLGSFNVERGRVTYIARNWDSAPDTRVAAINDVIKALTELKGQSGCVIYSTFAEEYSPRGEARGITVNCHGHSVRVDLATADGYAPSPGISEQWGR
jgi:hypothetical protein